MNKTNRVYPTRRVKGMSFYKTEDLSKILGLGLLTVRKYLREGKIKAVKLGQRWYVSSKNLNKFLNGD